MNLPPHHEYFLNNQSPTTGLGFPSSSRIQPSFANHHHLHHVRRQQQQQQQPLYSDETDVLCGRGKAFVDRPANRKFTHTIKANLSSYKNSKSRKGKTLIVESIVDQLQAEGIRFLKPQSGGSSYELNVFEAREKTGHALRDLIKQAGKKKKKKKTKNPKSDTTTTNPVVTSKYNATTKAINISTFNNVTQLHQEKTLLLQEPRNDLYSERSFDNQSLTMENLMEFGVFDLDDIDDDDALLKAASNNKTDSSRSCESFTPLPTTTTSNKISIKLADILKINDILSSTFAKHY